MNINIPNLIKSAVPEAEGRNVQIISDNRTNHRDQNFLSGDFPRNPPKLYITGENDDFDETTLTEWRNEGFDVEYISMESCGDGYLKKIKLLSREKMAPCEKFGIVAYDEAAAVCLEHFHVLDNNPEFRLGLLIAYYPTRIPDTNGKFPSSISALVHLAAGEEVGVVKQSQMVGIQGKKRVRRTRIQSGLGTGGKLNLAYPSYTYEAEPGFAEHDLEEYDGVSAELAWSRSLGAARKVFGINPDLEVVLENNLQSKFFSKNLDQALSTFTTHKIPHVTYMPTLTGATGAEELKRFYSESFTTPPSLKITLLSRTIGVDRVVDEMHVQFKHTEQVQWMLPGVPATNKKIEILMVSIVAVKGGRLHQEHVYWDQASVLVQAGLLDPKLLPQSAKDLGIEKLPVVGRRAARRVRRNRDGSDDEGEADNDLIPGWNEGERNKTILACSILCTPAESMKMNLQGIDQKTGPYLQPDAGSQVRLFNSSSISTPTVGRTFIRPGEWDAENDADKDLANNARYEPGHKAKIIWETDLERVDILISQKLGNSYVWDYVIRDTELHNISWTFEYNQGGFKDLVGDSVYYFSMYEADVEGEIASSQYVNVSAPEEEAIPSTRFVLISTTVTFRDTISTTQHTTGSKPTTNDPPPNETDTPSSVNAGLSQGAIAGIAVGAILGGVFIFGGLGWFLWNRSKRQGDPGSTNGVHNQEQQHSDVQSPKAELPGDSAAPLSHNARDVPGLHEAP
ncbi:hypothetical protein FGRMN_632 [Fusarium graminum]|nr:hypothetical protein FGRMN_632 [Fusarium graminum]